MKKSVMYLLSIAIIAASVWAGRFWYDNLRGAGPAFKAPERDITQDVTKNPSKATNTTGLPLKLPDGFSISIYARELGDPRVLALDPKGKLFVSIPSQGKVVALPEKTTVVDGLNRPHGLAFHDGKLYVAETDGVSVNKKKIVDLPGGSTHFSRTIGFGPDGKLYISVGSSCNVCVEKDWRRASILVYDGELKPFASGLRNSVFFTWHNGQMWATDMGRDLLGDNIPPEEVNIIEEGKDYGWPYCYADKVHDDNFDPKKSKSCEQTVSPKIMFQAHSAPLGLAFIPDSWPNEYRGDLLVAYHGSWNRTQPTGYKVVRFDLDENGKSKGESDFLTGFLDGNSALGRPVDLLFDSQGNLFISDDKSGVVYKVSQT